MALWLCADAYRKLCFLQGPGGQAVAEGTLAVVQRAFSVFIILSNAWQGMSVTPPTDEKFNITPISRIVLKNLNGVRINFSVLMKDFHSKGVKLSSR